MFTNDQMAVAIQEVADHFFVVNDEKLISNRVLRRLFNNLLKDVRGARPLGTTSSALAKLADDLETVTSSMGHIPKRLAKRLAGHSVRTSIDGTIVELEFYGPDAPHRRFSGTDPKDKRLYLEFDYRVVKPVASEIGPRLNPDDLERRHRQSLDSATASFYVPTFDVRIASQHAFSLLVLRTDPRRPPDDDEGEPLPPIQRPLKDELTRYHAPINRSLSREIDALDLIRKRRLVAIVGGPGAGKSTLALKLAHEMTREGRMVFFVRLKTLVRRTNGETFDDALRVIATLGSTPSESLQPQVLIADGLDECDPWRTDIAKEILQWAHAYPDSTVVVTTRRIGHSAALLPGFLEADLPHLTYNDIPTIAEPILAAAILDPARRRATLARLTNSLSSPRLYGIALRNPLLLTLVARLIDADVPVSGSRSEVYSHIVDTLRTSAPAGRHPATLEAATAMRVAEALAYAVIDDPGQSSRSLIKRVALSFHGSPDETEARVELAIQFWEEHRLIERIMLGPLESFTFVHPTFAEFLASATLHDMDDSQLLHWLRRAHKQPKWREVILFASATTADSDRIIRSLLLLTDPTDQLATAPLLASACAAESVPSTETTHTLLHLLAQRMTSSLRALAFESAAALVAVAPWASDEIAAAVEPLLTHDRLWTRVLAIGVAAFASSPAVTPSQAREFCDTFPSWLIELRAADTETNAPHKFWSSVAPSLVRILINADNSDPTHSYVLNLPLYDSMLRGFIKEYGRVGWLAHFVQDYNEKNKARSEAWRTESRNFSRAFLTWLQLSMGPTAKISPANPTQKDFPLFWRLRSVLDLNDQVFELDPAYSARAEYTTIPPTASTREVISGLLRVLNIDRDALASELNDALARINRGEDWSVHSLTSRMEPTIDWHRIPPLNLDPRLLINALATERYTIIKPAAQLLAHTSWTPSIAQDLLALLRHSRQLTMLAAARVIVEAFPPTEALEALDRRLAEATTPACGELYRYLLRIRPANELLRDKIERILLRGLRDEFSVAVCGAIRALRELKLKPDPLVDEHLIAAFNHWLLQPVNCKRCGDAITAYCDKCKYPGESPAALILRMLERRNRALGIDALVAIATSGGLVAPVARAILLERLHVNRELLCSVMTDLADTRRVDIVGADTLLEVVLQLDGHDLAAVEDQISELARIGRYSKTIMRSLVRGWTSPENAERLMHQLLSQNATALDNDLLDVRQVTMRSQ